MKTIAAGICFALTLGCSIFFVATGNMLLEAIGATLTFLFFGLGLLILIKEADTDEM